jgi:Na+/H+ antiporter NhaA
VLPLFALANAGVSLRNFSFAPAGALGVFVAVVAGRLLGKPLGIMLVAWGMGRAPSGRYDSRLGTHALLGVGTLAGVGFTVPLLITRAAFPDGPLVESATLGLLVGTLLCGLGGVIVLRIGGRGAATADGFDRHESAIRP